MPPFLVERITLPRTSCSVIIQAMPTVREAFTTAIQHHRSGRLPLAEQIYRQVVQADPSHEDAWHLLGILNAQTGNPQGAIECISRALSLRPHWAEARANLGNALREQGRLDEAAHHLLIALQLKPQYPEAWNNLGNVFKEQGHLEDAIASYTQALELKSDFPEAINNLGGAWKEKGRIEEAIACYRGAIDLRPDYVDANFNLGLALHESGRLDESIPILRSILDLNPQHAEAWNGLGNVFKDQGRSEEAIAAYRQAVQLRPGYFGVVNNLGIALRDSGELDEAIECFRQALEQCPTLPEVHNNLGISLRESGELDEAIECFRQALQLKPEFVQALYNLGDAFKAQLNLDDAIDCYRQALTIIPDHVEARNNLGNALRDQGQLDEAIACYRTVLELRPGYVEARNNLGNALKDQGQLEEAIACYRSALSFRPGYSVAHSNLLYTLHYLEDVTSANLAEAHAEYDLQHASHFSHTVYRHESILASNFRIRLGFVSPDLGQHPVGFFLVRVLEKLSHEMHDIFCYSDRFHRDSLTSRIQTASTEWHDVKTMSDECLADRIRADRIDILFDLAGHTANNRLLVFARKPAPIQLSWIGYEGTTGLTAMDYLLADRFMVPEGEEQHYRENVLRMPDGYLCFDPPSIAPQVGPPPSLRNGFVTFGSFNNPAKLNAKVVSVWSEILRRVPTARLVMKYRGLQDRSVKNRFLDLFATQGIGTHRLDLLPWSSYADYLATYERVDLVLDPFPFSGSTTTCDALWMGVPVITCPGKTFASRHSISHLSNVGLTETISCHLDEYVSLAISWARDEAKRTSLRRGLRDRMARSPLCDGERFATHLTAILRRIWERRIG